MLIEFDKCKLHDYGCILLDLLLFTWLLAGIVVGSGGIWRYKVVRYLKFDFKYSLDTFLGLSKLSRDLQNLKFKFWH